MRLFELEQQYLDFMALVEAGEIPPEAVADTFEALGGEIDAKIDNTACVIKHLVAEAAAIKAEEDAMKERRQRKEKAAENLKQLLSRVMQTLNKTKVETARNAISFRKSTAVVIDDEEAFKRAYPNFCTEKIEIKISSTAVRDSLKAGEEINGAHLELRQNIQIK